jgi:hypothetical protein
MGSTSSRLEGVVPNQSGTIKVHVLDIHLFVEALAFSALHIDSQNSLMVLPPS